MPESKGAVCNVCQVSGVGVCVCSDWFKEVWFFNMSVRSSYLQTVVFCVCVHNNGMDSSFRTLSPNTTSPHACTCTCIAMQCVLITCTCTNP